MGSEFTPIVGEAPDPEYFGVSKHGANRPADFDNEIPQHKVLLDKYRISKTPVTNAQYEIFTKATGYRVPGHWPEGVVTPELANHPVVYVDWADVQALLGLGCAYLLSHNGSEPPGGLMAGFGLGGISHQIRSSQITGKRIKLAAPIQWVLIRLEPRQRVY